MSDIIVPSDKKEIILNEFSIATRSRIISLVQQGYILAREATRHVSFLDWDLGKRHEGYLRPLAVNFLLKSDSEQGRLPFSHAYEYNKNKSHKFLVVHRGNIKLTVSQTDSLYSVARPAIFRKRMQESNNLRWNLFNEVLTVDENPELYMLLTFSSGGESPRFINLGLPGKNGWIERLNLLSKPHLLEIENQQPKEKEEVIEAETLVNFRKFTEEVEDIGSK
ncbi:hypothetical protein [uncultured Brevibacillus sp.]|uniref:hypothetical protein n=1 Tax=uncultured Brevibacillus sp. TaxID=169970 RepID=UPI002597FC49|nr:hypothetical protein [uncultured Brevibacillus sp.]